MVPLPRPVLGVPFFFSFFGFEVGGPNASPNKSNPSSGSLEDLTKCPVLCRGAARDPLRGAHGTRAKRRQGAHDIAGGCGRRATKSCYHFSLLKPKLPHPTKRRESTSSALLSQRQGRVDQALDHAATMRGAGVGRLQAPFAAASMFRPPCRRGIDTAARLPDGRFRFQRSAYRGGEWRRVGTAVCVSRDRPYVQVSSVVAAVPKRDDDCESETNEGSVDTYTDARVGNTRSTSSSKHPYENTLHKKTNFQSSPRPGAVMWFRQDLRVHDNQAFAAAVLAAKRRGGELICVYVWSETEDGNKTSWPMGEASRAWLVNSLRSLDADLRLKYGSKRGLTFMKGDHALALSVACKSVNSNQVFTSERFEPFHVQNDEKVRLTLKGDENENESVELVTLPGHLLFSPSKTQIDMANEKYFFGTLMPFVHAADKTGGKPGKPKPAPNEAPLVGGDEKKNEEFVKRLLEAGTELSESRGDDNRADRIDNSAAEVSVISDLDDLGILPASDKTRDWSKGIRASWDISEAGAVDAWRYFKSSKLEKYESLSNLTDDDSTAVSKLSPYLRFGQISVRQVYHELQVDDSKKLSRTFWHRLYRREFAYWQLAKWPLLPVKSVRMHYEQRKDWALGWSDESMELGVELNVASDGSSTPQLSASASEAFHRWQTGTTGFPAIDVGMRRLWATGWMHQQERMLCATFLVDYLGVDWRFGARWFHDTLVDADLAINSMMWQNAGKSGLDQWDVFSGSLLPDGSVRSHDLKGKTIAKWIPELAGLPEGHWRFKPWEAPEKVLRNANVSIGDEKGKNVYPSRMLPDAEKAHERMVRGVTETRVEHVRTAVERSEESTSTPNSVTSILVDVRTFGDYVLVPAGATLNDSHVGKLLPVSTRKEFKKALRSVMSNSSEFGASKSTLEQVKEWSSRCLNVGVTAAATNRNGSDPSADETGFARACEVGRKRSDRAEKDGTAHVHSHSHGGVTHSHSHGGHSHLPEDAIGAGHIGHTHGVGAKGGKGAKGNKGNAKGGSDKKKHTQKGLKSSSWATGRGSGAQRRDAAKESERRVVKQGRREARELAAWSTGMRVGDVLGGDEEEDEGW